MKKRLARRFGGFTLIELLVVVLIIGILASIAVPYFQKAVEMSRVASVIARGKAISQAQDRFYMQNNRYAPTVDALDISVGPCPAGLSCYEGSMASGAYYQMVRSGGPIGYSLVFSFGLRNYGQSGGRIYCVVPRSSPKSVEFCSYWGEESSISDSTHIRIFIE